jgi:hypothetical protein
MLHAAHLLDVERGALVSPGEVLVRGSRMLKPATQLNIPVVPR